MKSWFTRSPLHSMSLHGVVLLFVFVLLTPTSSAGTPNSMFNKDGMFELRIFLSGNQLMEHCDNNKVLAMGYIVGTSDCLNSVWYQKVVFEDSSSEEFLADCLKKMKTDTNQDCFVPPVCRPEGVSGTQLTDVVCKWLKENPERRHEDSQDLILSALRDAFPCEERPDFEDAVRIQLDNRFPDARLPRDNDETPPK